MEKIKKVKPPRKYESDFALRIVAIVVAVIIWVVLSITQYPTTTLKISNVPVIFNLEGTIAQEKGLHAVGYEDITTTVEIQGMKYEIGGYTDKDLTASVNLDDVTKEGTYNLEIFAKSAHSSDQCEVLSCYPKNVRVKFEHYSEQVMELEAEAPYIETQDQLKIQNTTVSPNEVTVTGSDNNLSKLKKVCAKVNDKKTLTEDTTISTTELVFYDENNNILPAENYTVDNKNFDVSFSLYKEQTMELAVDFKDCPEGFVATDLPYRLSTDKIKILTPYADENTSKTKIVGTISLSEIDLNNSFKFDIPFDKNEINLSDVKKVTVDFNSQGYSKKQFQIGKSKIKIKDAPSGSKTTINSPEKINATIFGPTSIISKLKADDLNAEINLKDINKDGTITKPIMIYSKRYNTVWCYGTHNATILVSD